MSGTSIFNMGRLAGLFAVSGAMLLSGCAAPTVAARVTSFQQWPAGVEGQSYQFVPADASQTNNLEYQSFQDMVRAGIGATGLVEAQAGAKPRFDVSFTYGTSQTQVMVRRPYDPGFYGGYGYGPGGYYGPRPWGGGFGYWGPDWVDVPMVVQRNALNLQIRDAQRGGAEVYRSSAYVLSDGDNLLRTMPYLVRAIFDNFPGNNGAEREIQFPVQ
ncbi:DUF4136 domain-containing protein [Achromobacter sp. Marseille-Q0513]|uniref:DUF4136 domain-containing protein n=1 Tax=Achromobacter sp. Marseille-Q0513 TaxID=2829161 RepID=UPI001B9BAA76|nr:DUF4136 domain-containing protein [Achromobacter sp. Marseille-Q0513]MBR8655067.1 DUF4136 domain-containing protein [Achromobacter sp. Marseille-Q0513]